LDRTHIIRKKNCKKFLVILSQFFKSFHQKIMALFALLYFAIFCAADADIYFTFYIVLMFNLNLLITHKRNFVIEKKTFVMKENRVILMEFFDENFFVL
jgi:hypothetical protein